MGNRGGDRIQGHGQDAVGAVRPQDHGRLGTSLRERDTVPGERQQILANGAVGLGIDILQHGEENCKSAVATVDIGQMLRVNACAVKINAI